MNALHKSSCNSLEQIEVILSAIHHQQIENSKEYYINYDIGRHVRHIIDHFISFKNGLANGVIDYNQRSRNSIIETNLFSSREIIQNLIEWLGGLEDSNQSLSIYSEIDCNQEINNKFTSNKDRELLYLINHTIHHAAYIKLLLQQSGFTLPDYIGIAPCTSTYLREENLVY
jgi:uncharacterized damage-inducible protein DinB